MTFESHSFRALCQIASEHSSVSSEKLAHLMEMVSPPPRLQALYLVLENLNNVLPLADSICRLEGNTAFSEKMILPAIEGVNELIRIQDRTKESTQLSHLFPIEGSSAEDSLDGYFESHPMYSLLAHRADIFDPKSDFNKKYRNIQAQIFLACQKIEVGTSKDMLTYFRGARFLCQSTYRAFLCKVPEETLSSEDFLNQTSSAPSRSRLALARQIILAAKGKDFLKEFQRKPQTTTSKAAHSENTVEEDVSKESQWVGTNIIKKSSLSEKLAKEYENIGGHRDEMQSPFDDVPIVAPEERTFSRSTLRELAFQARQRSNKIAISNQLNPFAWQEMNQFDLHTLLTFLEDEDPAEDLSHEETRQVKLILTLMFWLSCPFERALNIKFSASGFPTEHDTECIYWSSDNEPYVRLHSPGPELNQESKDREFKLACQVTYFTKIPLAATAKKVLLNNLPFSVGQQSFTEKELFIYDPDEEEEATQKIKGALRRLNNTHGTRLTMGRINLQLLRTLARWPGEDLPSAMLFFGREEREAATRLHYTCAPVIRLTSSYKDMCNTLSEELIRNVEFDSSEAGEEPQIYLGTTWCPTQSTVQNLVSKLQEDIEDNRLEKGDLGLLAKFHNFFTLYTAQFIAFATSYRAIRDPSFHAQEIDRKTGLAVISDKDDDFNYSTRLVWLSNDCLDQIDNYCEHLRAIWSQFGTTSRPFFDIFKQHSGNGSPLTLFLVDYDFLTADQFRPGITKDLLWDNHNYDLPPNSNRHYLKNQLQKEGCPPEIIEFLLGHWELGMEPWNSLSNLHPLKYRNTLKKYLEPILKRDGWRPVKGFTR